MATVTLADVEAAHGRSLSWWERVGFWWENLTASTYLDPRGLEEDQSVWLSGLIGNEVGDVSGYLMDTTYGGFGAELVETGVNTAEQVSKGNKLYWVGIGVLVVVGGGVCGRWK